MAQKSPQPVANKRVKDVVHQDRNWVTRIQNELHSNENWNHRWGYLSGGIAKLDETTLSQPKAKSIDSRIDELQQTIKDMGGKNLQTTNGMYGTGQKLEMFKNDKYHIHECHDLRALERRLPKNWKKTKWTPPDDPYDELKKLNKKK